MYILATWISAHPEQISLIESIALAITTNTKVIQNQDNTLQFNWSTIVKILIPNHTKEISKSILITYCDPNSNYPRLSYSSEPYKILLECVRYNAEFFWETLKIFLEDATFHDSFVIGFPSGLIDLIPKEKIYEWISPNPTERAQLIIALCAQNFEDTSLFSNIIERFGSYPQVASTAANRCFSGTFNGEYSIYCQDVIFRLESISTKTQLINFKSWILNTIKDAEIFKSDIRQQELERSIGR